MGGVKVGRGESVGVQGGLWGSRGAHPVGWAAPPMHPRCPTLCWCPTPHLSLGGGPGVGLQWVWGSRVGSPPTLFCPWCLGGGSGAAPHPARGFKGAEGEGGQAVHPSICCVPSAPLPKIISPPNCPSRRPSSRNHPGRWAQGGALGEGGTKRGGDPHRGILLGGGLGTPWGILDEGCRTLGEFMGVLGGVWGPQLGFRGLSPCGGAVGVSTGVSAEVSVGVSAGVSTGGPGGVPPSVPPISRAVREVTAQETAAPSPPGPPTAASEGAPTPGDAAEGG